MLGLCFPHTVLRSSRLQLAKGSLCSHELCLHSTDSAANTTAVPRCALHTLMAAGDYNTVGPAHIGQ